MRDLPECYLISSQLTLLDSTLLKNIASGKASEERQGQRNSIKDEEHLVTSRCESCTQLIRLLLKFLQSICLIDLFLRTKSSLGIRNWRRWTPAQENSPPRTTVTERFQMATDENVSLPIGY